MTQEEKQKMIEEQRAIMEQIQREAMNNKASVAAIKADAFASRMTGNPQGQTGGVDGFSASEVEEQRRIYEQIQKEAKGMNANSSSEGATTVDIGGGQHVNIHGQEKTQESIREGTAVLVECLNCNNWMQVAENATLMFCPICSVVSPVVKGDHDMQVAHLTQMEEDRKLAEQLQKEESEAYRQSSSNRRSATSRAAPVVEGSWWDSLSKGMNNAMVAMGVVADEENDPAHMSVSRPPGAVSPGQRSLHAATTGEEGSEREGLLQAEGGNYDYRRREARVAQSQPLFSCIVDSVANTASAVSSAVYGDDDDEVHGVDSSPLFAVPKTGRDRNAGGSYHALPDDS
jgi:Zn finger protein HypA/HybF involved in hydrogenase expression